LGCLDSELSVTFVSDARIAQLAGDYGRERKPTDVLAFPTREGPGAEYLGGMLGDVVISLETASRQARERRTTLDVEVRDLLIHGVLHLLGMDHYRAADGRAMREVEARLRDVVAG